MNKTTEIKIFVALTSKEPPQTKITFREESARDIRYTLTVRTDDSGLLRKLARIFGCPDSHLPCPSKKQFEAYDKWHGGGRVDLRELADEFMQTHGEFFDFDATLADLRLMANAM